jgi:hypothetical protein
MKSNVAPQRKVTVNVFPGKSKQMKTKRRYVESSSVKDLCDSFHDLSDDASIISINEIRPIHWHEEEEQEAMADAFLENDFPFQSGK